MRIDFNYPVELADAIESVACFNNETVNDVIERNPKMFDDNVMEDDESIYLLRQKDRGHIIPYYIPKCRLEEDWNGHLKDKPWCDTQMLIAFRNLKKKILKIK